MESVSKNLSLMECKFRSWPSFCLILPSLLIVLHVVFCFVVAVCLMVFVKLTY